MATAAPVANVRNVKSEMQAHRERLKQAVHPGRTQKEAGMTTEERQRLVMGVCSDLSAARGVWNGLKVSVVIWILLLTVLLVGYAVRGPQAPPPVPQQVTVR